MTMALTDFVPMMERCSNCLGCKWIPFDKIRGQRFSENCPSISFSNFNTYSARGRFELGLALHSGAATLSGETTRAIHECMACGACDVACKVTRYNLEPLEHNLELKAYAVENDATLPAMKPLMDSLAAEKTMLPGRLRADRSSWARGLGLKDLSANGKAEVLFFPGCKFSYDEGLGVTARKSASLLLKIGVDLGYLGSLDMCCAGRALQMGYKDDFERNARANMAIFAKAGIRTIVTPCSDCYHAFKRQYARRGMDIEVLHVVELLDRMGESGNLKFTKALPMTVTYHDPCHLGRLGEKFEPWSGKEKKILNQVHTWEPRRPRYSGAEGIYDAPRRLLKSIPGVELVEMDRIREYSWCCGSGGGCSETSPDLASFTASERIAEARATGAEALVTACPWCESSLSGARDPDGRGMQVLDLVDLVDRAL